MEDFESNYTAHFALFQKLNLFSQQANFTDLNSKTINVEGLDLILKKFKENSGEVLPKEFQISFFELLRQILIAYSEFKVK